MGRVATREITRYAPLVVAPLIAAPLAIIGGDWLFNMARGSSFYSDDWNAPGDLFRASLVQPPGVERGQQVVD